MSDTTPGRDSVRFSDRVDPGGDARLTYELDRDATVEQIDVRIYRGPRHDLQIKPFIEADENQYPPLELEGKDYIDGEDDALVFPVTESVEEEDVIGVEVSNLETNHGYDFSVDYLLDYEAGTLRSIAERLRRMM